MGKTLYTGTLEKQETKNKFKYATSPDQPVSVAVYVVKEGNSGKAVKVTVEEA